MLSFVVQLNPFPAITLFSLALVGALTLFIVVGTFILELLYRKGK